MKVFELDIKKLSILLLPTFYRKTRIVAWLYALVTPLVSLYYRFTQKRNDDLYKLRHNGQVCYLRAALNDAFDADLRRIEIADGNRYKRQYIYTEAEQKPCSLGTMYLRDSSVYGDTGVDFLVLIPQEVWDAEKTEVATDECRFYEIEGLVDYYRLASKRYKIQLL